MDRELPLAQVSGNSAGNLRAPAIPEFRKFPWKSAAHRNLRCQSTASPRKKSKEIGPISGTCERVFSLLKQMFGDDQISTLADAIRAALMVRYNDRVVG